LLVAVAANLVVEYPWPDTDSSFLLQAHDAGHMVPMDQPKAALEMLKRWTSRDLGGESSTPAVAEM